MHGFSITNLLLIKDNREYREKIYNKTESEFYKKLNIKYLSVQRLLVRQNCVFQCYRNEAGHLVRDFQDVEDASFL